MGFTKLDGGLLQSSIMAAPFETFKTFIAILASTGPDGIARVSSTFLSAACYLPIAKVDKALAALEAPDPRSRSLNDDGRRIRRVDGGYFVINYEKYRAFTPQAGDPSSPGAARTRRWREKRAEGVSVTSPNHGDVSSASVLSSPSSISSEEEVQEREVQFNEFWKAYPREGRHAKQESRRRFMAIARKGEFKDLTEGFHGYLDFLKYQKDDHGFDQHPMYAKTFLNDRWREFIGFKFEAKL